MADEPRLRPPSLFDHRTVFSFEQVPLPCAIHERSASATKDPQASTQDLLTKMEHGFRLAATGPRPATSRPVASTTLGRIEHRLWWKESAHANAIRVARH
jgi:hypothetical protein